jgi:hypothetical protein
MCPNVLTGAEDIHSRRKRSQWSVFQVSCLGTSHTDVCGAVGETEVFTVREAGGIRS